MGKDILDRPLILRKEKRNIKENYERAGEILNKFDSVTNAAKFVNGTTSLISACCKSKRNKHKGYKWAYVKDCPA